MNLVQVLPKGRFGEMISFEFHLKNRHEKTQKPLWFLGFQPRYLFRCYLLARSTEKDITGFFEKAACGKAFSGFFINPYCLTCSGCDTFSFFVRTEKDILIHLKSNFISYLLPLRISQNGIFNISIVVMQKIDRFFAEKVRGINNSCSCKI